MQAKGKEIDEEKMFANDRLKVEILKSDQTSFFIKYFVTKKFIKTPIIIMYSAFKSILVERWLLPQIILHRDKSWGHDDTFEEFILKSMVSGHFGFV